MGEQLPYLSLYACLPITMHELVGIPANMLEVLTSLKCVLIPVLTLCRGHAYKAPHLRVKSSEVTSVSVVGLVIQVPTELTDCYAYWTLLIRGHLIFQIFH